MSEVVHIPMFPLAILPLRGACAVHLFEPRYKQLLQDAEITIPNSAFTLATSENEQKLGSLISWKHYKKISWRRV